LYIEFIIVLVFLIYINNIYRFNCISYKSLSVDSIWNLGGIHGIQSME